MQTYYAKITTDADGNGQLDIAMPRDFIFTNLRGFFDPDRVEFFRLYYQIIIAGAIVESGEGGGGGGGGSTGGRVVLLSEPEIVTGQIVRPNQILRIKVSAGTKYANAVFNVAFDWKTI